MINRLIHPKRTGRRFLVGLAAASIVIGTFGAGTSVLAVHDENVFQLDGNASTALNSTPPAAEDWDLICKANNVTIGTLAAAITTTGATTISVTETKAPTIIPFNIQIDAEQMTVTARTTANPRVYTVTRGFNGTTAATHASGAAIKGGCLFNPGYSVPAGATLASPDTFVVDPSTSATDDILKGGTKDDNDITSWSWTSAKPSPPKNDITDGYAAEYTCKGSGDGNNVPGCTGTAGDKLLYFGGDRYSINGVANIAFWFFQKSVAQNPNAANGQCTISSGCNFVDKAGNPATHKVGNVSLGGSTPGDILVISAFGPHALVNVYEWVGPGNATKDYLGTNSCFTAACSLQPLFVGGQECGNNPGQSGNNDPACAIANSVSTPSPWPLPQAAGGNNQFSADTVHASSAFFEGGLNLTSLGLGGACFSSFLINTRASAAGDAELHDKVMGQFQRCAPNLTTQASTNGTVQPGTAVHDSATVQVTGATSPDDATGTVDFFLCADTTAPFEAPDCTTGGTAAGAGIALTDTSNPANTTDGKSGANSSDVNTALNPLGNGYYCFRAETHLTNYDNPDPATNTTTECFQVLKLATSIVTDPQSPAGTNNTGPFNLADSTSVYDHAVVTGDSLDGDPTGKVSFFICNPSQVDGTGGAGTEFCPDSAGSQVGSDVTVTAISNSSPPQTEATSAAVTANLLGVWCFRASYTSDTPVYDNSSGDGHRECFTVRTTSSASTVQKWLPNDAVTISTAGSVGLTGSLSIQLLSGTCPATGGTVVYTEPTNQTLSGVASGTTFNTTNSATFVTAANNATPYFWRSIFTPTSSFIAAVTKCEKTDITINNNP